MQRGGPLGGFYETIKIKNDFVEQKPDFPSPPTFQEVKFTDGCHVSLRVWDEIKSFLNMLLVIFQHLRKRTLVFWTCLSVRPLLPLQTSEGNTGFRVSPCRFDATTAAPNVSAALIRSLRNERSATSAGLLHTWNTLCFSGSLAVNALVHGNLNDVSSPTCNRCRLEWVSRFQTGKGGKTAAAGEKCSRTKTDNHPHHYMRIGLASMGVGEFMKFQVLKKQFTFQVITGCRFCRCLLHP